MIAPPVLIAVMLLFIVDQKKCNVTTNYCITYLGFGSSSSFSHLTVTVKTHFIETNLTKVRQSIPKSS